MKLSKVFGIIALIAIMVQSFNVVFGAFPSYEVHEEFIDGVHEIYSFPFQTHSVYSNRTRATYYFYAQGFHLKCKVLDITGNELDDYYIWQDSGAVYGWKGDFSVCIHPSGDRLYLALKYKQGQTGISWANNTRVYSLLVNEETKRADVIDIEIITDDDKQVDAPSRAIDIVCTGELNPHIAYIETTRQQSTIYFNEVFISNSTNTFTFNKFIQVFSSELFLQELSVTGLSNRECYAGISNYQEDGLSCYLQRWHNTNNYCEDEALFLCFDTQSFIDRHFDGTDYSGQYWQAEGHKAQQQKPEDYIGIRYSNILGNFGEIVHGYYERNGDYLRHFEYNGTSDSYSEYNVFQHTDTNHPIAGFAVNDRQSWNMIVWNENMTTVSGLPIYRYYNFNETTNQFDSVVPLSNFRNSETGAGISPESEYDASHGSQYALEASLYDNATIGIMTYENSGEIIIYQLDDQADLFKFYPDLENGTIVDGSGNSLSVGDWLYQGEVYTFSFDTNNLTEAGYIQFDDNDATIRIRFNTTTNRVTLERDLEENKISIIDYEQAGDSWNISFTLGEGIDDALNVDFSYWVQNYGHNLTATGTYISGLNIYNLGGFTFDRTVVNTGGFFEYGNPLEVWSQYNAGSSYANTSQVYRKLQWFHSQFALDVTDNDVFDTKENTGDVEIHLEYLENGVWQDLIYVQFDIPNGAVDPAGAGAGKAWVDISFNWYARNDAGNMASFRNGYFVAYPDCGDDVNSDATTLQLWLDLWIDRANNSRSVGGTLSPTFYGMDETGFLLFNSWRPIMTNATLGTVTVPLRNSTGSIIQADQIDLMRVSTWVITGSALDTNVWAIRDFKNQDYLLAEGRLRGIDKPAIVEPLIVDMPSSGFLSGLRKAINALGQTIINALAGAWKTSIGLIDTILEFLGLGEGLFSSLVYVLGELLEIFNLVLAEFETLITYALNSVTELLRLVIAVSGRVIFTANIFVTTILQYYNSIVSLFTGGWSDVGNMWNQFDILVWVQFWLIAFFPFWELDRISKSQNPMGTIKGDVESVFGLITGVLRVFVFLWQLIEGILGLIINIVRG